MIFSHLIVSGIGSLKSGFLSILGGFAA